MKKFILKYSLMIAAATMLFSFNGCKEADSNAGSSTLSIDISGLLQNLPVSSSNSSSSVQSTDSSSQVSSPSESDAQTAVQTLMIVPLTYSKHGKPYTITTFDKKTEDDFEDDAANSANYLKFIQLPTGTNTVEVDVPAISDGWQLLAAATTAKVENVEGIDGATIAYLGFTEQAFKSADDFNSKGTSLTLIRHCDQDSNKRPKGCATYDGSKKAIVTSAVEIHKVYINNVEKTVTGAPLIVRDTTGVANAETVLNGIISSYVGDTITSIAVHVTHQKSDGKSAACVAATSSTDLIEYCGVQVNSRSY